MRVPPGAPRLRVKDEMRGAMAGKGLCLRLSVMNVATNNIIEAVALFRKFAGMSRFCCGSVYGVINEATTPTVANHL